MGLTGYNPAVFLYFNNNGRGMQGNGNKKYLKVFQLL